MPYQRFHSKKTEYKGPTRAAINRSSMAGWLDVHSPYSEKYVQELKDSIQPSHRKWNPEQGVWRVNELYLDILVPLLKKYFDEVSTDLLVKEAPSDNMFKPIFEALKGLPDGNIDKVYRQLAIAVHPDHGGTDELMRKLNQAYQFAKEGVR